MNVITEVVVEPYVPIPLAIQGHQTPHFTKLFRSDARLERVAELALDASSAESEDLTILSVGSSFGAEADSMLALLESRDPAVENVRMVGLDTNPHVLRAARQGKYVIPGSRHPDPDALRAAMPFFSISEESDRWPLSTVDGFVMIDTNQVRDRHDVRFLQGDLSEEGFMVDEADVVLCNNVLYHLSERKAERLVKAIAATLRPGGILSLEASVGPVFMNRGSNVEYEDWRRYIADKLRLFWEVDSIGVSSTKGIPSLFRKRDKPS